MKNTLTLVALLVATPAYAQIDAIQRRAGQAQKLADMVFTDAEERQIGDRVSTLLRDRYGVVQDAKVTRYVTLVGTVLAKATSRPALNWQFIVLDTDAVNAYAAPGGIIHVTRGALALMRSEAELAGILGHEITHVVEKHTIRAIQKGKLTDALTDEMAGNRGLLLNFVGDKVYESVVENAFDRGDENESDKNGVVLAGKAGYASDALSSVLTRIADRNQGREEPNGLFASHPVIKDRIDRIAKAIKDAKLAAGASGQTRYAAHVTYKPVPVTAVVMVEGARGLTGGSDAAPAAASKEKDAKAAETKKPRLGLGSVKSVLSSGSQKQSTQVVASAGARGGVPDRDAKGGPNKGVVTVRVTDADLAAFKAAID